MRFSNNFFAKLRKHTKFIDSDEKISLKLEICNAEIYKRNINPNSMTLTLKIQGYEKLVC